MRLLDLVPPPSESRFAFPPDFISLVSSRFFEGRPISFPADASELLAKYGPGDFLMQKDARSVNSLHLMHPLSKEHQKSIFHVLENTSTIEGLDVMPVMDDDDGSLVFVSVDLSGSSRATIFLNPSHSEDFIECDYGLGSYLAEVFSGKIKCPLWPKYDFSRIRVTFTPARRDTHQY